MKKKISLIVSVMLVVALLAGCSPGELGYLKMGREIGAMGDSTIKGSMTLSYNQEDLLGAIEDAAWVFAGEKTDFTASGTMETITLDYTMHQRQTEQGLALELESTAKLKGKSVNLGKAVLDMEKGVFVSGNFVAGIYEIASLFDVEHAEAYAYKTEFVDKIRKSTGDSEYICVVNAEDLKTALGDDVSLIGGKQQTEAILDAAIKFITDGFQGFSTDCVSSISGGYEIYLDAPKLLQLSKNLTAYLGKNIDVVMKAFKEYMGAVAQSYGDDELYKQITSELGTLEMTKEEKVEFSLACSEIYKELDKTQVKDLVNAFGGSFYKMQVKKSGTGYTENAEFVLAYQKTPLVKLDVKAEMVPFEGKISTPAKSVPMEQFMADFEQLFETANPLNATVITWEKSSKEAAPYVTVDYERTYEEPTLSPQQTWDIYEAQFVKNEIYVPLRDIAEGMGEVVKWDNKTKQAYIEKNGSKVYVQGMLIEKTTYVKVKEFEKLGYKVTYKSLPGEHRVDVVPVK